VRGLFPLKGAAAVVRGSREWRKWDSPALLPLMPSIPSPTILFPCFHRLPPPIQLHSIIPSSLRYHGHWGFPHLSVGDVSRRNLGRHDRKSLSRGRGNCQREYACQGFISESPLATMRWLSPSSRPPQAAPARTHSTRQAALVLMVSNHR
jgi:hypothetical protein